MLQLNIKPYIKSWSFEPDIKNQQQYIKIKKNSSLKLRSNVFQGRNQAGVVYQHIKVTAAHARLPSPASQAPSQRAITTHGWKLEQYYHTQEAEINTLYTLTHIRPVSSFLFLHYFIVLSETYKTYPCYIACEIVCINLSAF